METKTTYKGIQSPLESNFEVDSNTLPKKGQSYSTILCNYNEAKLGFMTYYPLKVENPCCIVAS